MKRRSNHMMEVGRHAQGQFHGLNGHQESLLLNHNGTAKHELVFRLFNLFRSSDQVWKNGQKLGQMILVYGQILQTPHARPGPAMPRENSASDKYLREFDFRKDELAFFEKECSRILDHIYLGGDAVAKNREILRQNGITHLLNCVGFVCPEYFKNEVVYKTLWPHDCPSEDITSILDDVFDYFEDVREQDKRVLVHCCQGVSRSNSLVIAYLMWKEGMSFDDAFQHVKAAKGVTNPNVGFACQLLQCQKRVHALPASPTSVLRMYRMAPHSPYDPLHLVPKMLCEPQ